MTGLRWAKEVLDNALFLIGLAALTAGVAVGGVLLHEPGWFLGVFGGLLLLLVFGQGAYRVWDETDKRLEAAEGAQAPLRAPMGMIAESMEIGRRAQEKRIERASDILAGETNAPPPRDGADET